MSTAEGDPRREALGEIARLAREHGLTRREIAHALAEDATARGEGRGGVVVRVLAYLGGIFVFAGIGVFVVIHWDEMNSAARIVVTLGSGVAAFVLALIAAADVRYEKATTPLFLIAAALEPTGMMVTFNEFSRGGDWHYASLVTAGTVALQYGLVFRKLDRGTLLFVTLFFGLAFAWVAMDLLDMDPKLIGLTLGASMLLLSMGIDHTRHAAITPPWYLLGSMGFLYALFDLVEGSAVEIVFLAAACGLVYVSVLAHSRTLLFTSTIAILSYTGYFTGKHFAHSVGWPIALVAFGLAMIGLSALALRIDRRYLRPTAPSEH
jgi:hypothetical protein